MWWHWIVGFVVWIVYVDNVTLTDDCRK